MHIICIFSGWDALRVLLRRYQLREQQVTARPVQGGCKPAPPRRKQASVSTTLACRADKGRKSGQREVNFT